MSPSTVTISMVGLAALRSASWSMGGVMARSVVTTQIVVAS